MDKKDRIGVAVYLYYNRDARKVSKFGDVHYHSRRLRYLVLYIDVADLDEVVSYLEKQKFVKDIKVSSYKAINQNFVGNLHQEELDIEKNSPNSLTIIR